MSEFTEIEIILPDDSSLDRDIIIACLSGVGYDTFVEEEHSVKAYIPSDQYNEQILNKVLEDISQVGSIPDIKLNRIPEKNWNEEWERNYSPVLVGEKCLVRAPFHEAVGGIPIDIIIFPKMSFGTAHHPTTYLMIAELQEFNLARKRVLDMGCGTGVLSILAEKLGAEHVEAVDIDSRACDNARENIILNKCQKVQVTHSDNFTSADSSFHFVLANINRNTLLEEMERFSRIIITGGKLMLSGFYEEDQDSITNAAFKVGFVNDFVNTKDSWMVAVYRKAH